MRTTMDLDDRLLIQAKKAAAESSRTLTSLVEDALRLALRETRRSTPKEAFHIASLKGGRRLLGLNLDCTGAVLDHLDGFDGPSRR